MGRQLRRVPLDFNHPIGKTWPGFLNPWYEFSHDCKSCSGSGYSKIAKLYQDQWYGNAPFDPVAYGSKHLSINDPSLKLSVELKIRRIEELIAEGHEKRNYYTDGGRLDMDTAIAIEVRRMFGLLRKSWMHQLNQADVDALVKGSRLTDFTHFWTGEKWQQKDPPCHPTADDVNAWSMYGFGHDSINCMVCVRSRCEREGIDMLCPVCNGEGSHWIPADAKQKAEEWNEEEPPVGEGYQIWETVSEGSPVSPVFRTPEQLAEWMVKNRTGVDADVTYEGWMRFICGKGWAPSGMMVDGVYQSGVAALNN